MPGFPKYSKELLQQHLQQLMEKTLSDKMYLENSLLFSDKLQRVNFTEKEGFMSAGRLDCCLNVLGVFPLQQAVRRVALERSL